MLRKIFFSAIVMGALSFSAQAVVIDFEEFPHEDELQGAGDIIFSKGYQLTYAAAPDEPHPVGFTTVGPSWPYNGRSAALIANSCGATTTLTAQDNNPFTLKSIDLAGVNGDTEIFVAFTGVTISDKIVQKVIKLHNQEGWKTISFPPKFQNLSSVTWVQGDCIANPPHMFDNIDVFPTDHD